jgi:hypothetical protein
MYRKKSLHNKSENLRNVIILAVGLPTIVFGILQFARFFSGESTLAEDSSGLVPGCAEGKCYQELFAYVKSGEIIEATLTVIQGGYESEGGPYLPEEDGDIGNRYCDILGEAPDSIYCAPGYPVSNNPELAKVTINGPGGKIYSAHFDEDFKFQRSLDAGGLGFHAGGGFHQFRRVADQNRPRPRPKHALPLGS